MTLSTRFFDYWMLGLFRAGCKATLQGIPTTMIPFSEPEQRTIVFGKVERALTLVKQYSPVRFRQVGRDVKRILVVGDHSTSGRYVSSLKMCDLPFNLMLDEGTTAGKVAAIIVHEAQHGRLIRLGFRNTARTEEICYRAERAFAARMPDGKDLIEDADYAIRTLPTARSSMTRENVRVRAMEKLGLPKWLLPLFVAAIRRQHRTQNPRRPTKG